MQYSNLVASGLVGRVEELGALDRSLRAVQEGKTAVVVLSGEPGIGKTALLGYVVDRSRALGCQVLSGSASELEQDLPFAVFRDALAAAAESMPSEGLGLLADEEIARLATVFPSLARTSAASRRRSEPDERHLTLLALQALLAQLARDRPLVLALDDLHWADPASIDMVCRLLHRGLAEPSLLALASRPGQTEPRLETALGEAEYRARARRIELGPLSPAEARELLGADIGPALAEGLYRHSGGNPFYLGQLAAARGRETLPPPDAASGDWKSVV